MITDQDREMAQQAAQLLGGTPEQIEMVAGKLAEWRAKIEWEKEADVICRYEGIHPIHQR